MQVASHRWLTAYSSYDTCCSCSGQRGQSSSELSPKRNHLKHNYHLPAPQKRGIPVGGLLPSEIQRAQESPEFQLYSQKSNIIVRLRALWGDSTQSSLMKPTMRSILNSRTAALPHKQQILLLTELQSEVGIRAKSILIFSYYHCLVTSGAFFLLQQ